MTQQDTTEPSDWIDFEISKALTQHKILVTTRSSGLRNSSLYQSLNSEEEIASNLKATITAKLREARYDELDKAIQQFIFSTSSNPNNFSDYATARLKHLEGEEHHD
jgi:glutamate mutase epsilon subunit